MTSEATTAGVARSAAPHALFHGLQRLRRRVRGLLALRLASIAVAVLAGAAAVAVVLLRLRAVWFPRLLPEAAPAAALLLAGLAARAWPLPDALLAASADRRLHLRDRLATALQLLRTSQPTGMEQAQVSDALDCIARVHPREAFPVRLLRVTKLALAALLSLVLVQLLPIPPLLLSAREQEARAFLKEQAAKIEPVAKELQQKAKEANDMESERLAAKLQALSGEFRAGHLDKKQALVRLDEVKQQLVKNTARLTPPSPKTAGQAADELQKESQRNLSARAEQLADKAGKAGQKEEAARLIQLAAEAQRAKTPEQLAKLASQVEKASSKLTLSSEAMAKLAKALADQDLQKASETLKELSQLPDGMTPEEMKELAKQLASMAKSLSGTDLKEAAKQLAAAAECAQSGECKSASAALAKASAAAAKAGRQARLAEASAKAAQAGDSGSQRGAGPGDSKGRLDRNSPFARIYAQRKVDVNPTRARVHGQLRPGAMQVAPGSAEANQRSASQVPYYEVINQYSKSAEEALAKEEVPPAYKDSVREYFRKLQASGAQAGAKK